MARVILFVLMCATLIGLGNCTAFFWNTTFASGTWNDGRFWQNGTAPGSGDCAYINGVSGTITIPGGITIGNVTFNSAATVIITGGQFTVTGVMAIRAGITLRVDTAASLSVGNQIEIGSGGITLNLIGTVTAGGLKATTAAYGTNGITNNGPSSILLTGAVNHVIDANFGITANNFIFSQTATHTFIQTSPTAAPSTLSFTYTPTITAFQSSNNYYNPMSIGYSFIQGANFLTQNPIIVTNSSGTKPAVNFQATLSLSNAQTNIVGTPSFSGSTVVINGGTLQFSDVSVTFGSGGTLNIIGTGGLTFASGDSNGRAATFSGTVNVYVNPFTFTRSASIPPNWSWSGSTVNIYTNYTISTVISISNNPTFFFPVTLATGAHLRGGAATFWDSIINNAGTQAWTFTPVLKCNGAFFNVTGTGTFNLLSGVTIEGCTINTQNNGQINVNSPINVNANSTIDLQQVSLNITGTSSFTFGTLVGPPTNSLYSLTIKNSFTNIPVNFTFTASGIDVVVNSTFGLVFGTTLAGTGQFTLNGGLTIGENNMITATVALPSGPYSITQTSPPQALSATWGGRLILRNTIVTGTALINFSGTIVVLNGFSYINTNNFVINNAVTVTYLANTTGAINFVEAPFLVFNAGSTRNLGFSITADNKVNVVFNDALTLTQSLTFMTSNDGTITFNQTGTTTLALNGAVSDTYSVNGRTVFNSTNTRITNNGIFTINGNITTNGNINNPQATGDATVMLSPTFIVAATNTIFGPTVLLGSGGFQTDDTDRNSSTAITSITFNYTSALYPVSSNSYTFLTNVTFLGPVLLKSTGGVTFTGQAGFLTFSGNCLLIQSSVTFNIRTIFSNAVNISDNSAGTGFTVTVNKATFPTGNNDGLWLGGNVFLNQGITLSTQSNLNIYFLNSLSIFGTGILTTSSATFIGTNAAVTIRPLTVNLNTGTGPTTFLGSGATTFTFNPFSNNGNFATDIVANVPVSYAGSALTLTGSTTFPTAFTFTAATTTFNGAGPLTFSGPRTLSATNAYVFNNLASVTFKDTVTLNNAVPFSSTGTPATTITFQYDVVLGTPVSIALNVVFGVNSFSSVTVSGNTLTLTGSSVTVNGGVIITSSIVSNKNTGSNQIITGTSASFGNLWSYSAPVDFAGIFNFTTTMTFSLTHNLRTATLTFPQGLSFSGSGGLVGTGTICLFGYLNNTINTAVTLPPGVTVATAGTPFTVTGLLVINGTYTCRGQVTFANSITFGYNINLGSSLPINWNDNCQWLGSTSTITIYRNTINTNSLTTIFTPLVFACANTSTTTISASASTLFINADVTISAPRVNFNGASLGPINIITTYNGAFINNLNPTNVLTFNSNPTTAEPIVTFFGALSQPVNLLAPVRFDNLNLGPNSALYSTNSQGRADLADSLSASSTVLISVQTNLFVTSNATGTVYTVTLTSDRSTLSLTPTLNSPFGYPAPNFVFSVSFQNSVIRFTANPSLTFNNVQVSGSGATRFSQGTVTVLQTLQVNSGATFWQDLSTITANNFTVVPAPSSTGNPGYYQLSVASNTPPTVTTQYAVYGGAAVVYLSNFNPTQSITFTAITTNLAAFGNVLNPITGTPGFSYSNARNGNSLTITITPNAAPTVLPTQSNGPAPPVSSAPSQIFSFVVLFVSFILVFISLC